MCNVQTSQKVIGYKGQHYNILVRYKRNFKAGDLCYSPITGTVDLLPNNPQTIAYANSHYYPVQLITRTLFQRWNDNEHGYTGYGSFQTAILQAYRLADLDNQARLEKAFPDWFVKPAKPY